MPAIPCGVWTAGWWWWLRFWTRRMLELARASSFEEKSVLQFLYVPITSVVTLKMEVGIF